MPIHPLQTSRNVKTVRIEPGAIVEYEQHGKPILAVVLLEKRGKWTLLNQMGQEVTLEPARLYLVPDKMPPTATSVAERMEFLANFERRVLQVKATLELSVAWEILSHTTREVSVDELADILVNNTRAVELLAVRRLLLEDRIFFKRRKSGFEPRPPETVRELTAQLQREGEKARERMALVDALVERSRGKDVSLPPDVAAIEGLAALGSRADGARESATIVEEAARRLGGLSETRVEDRAFELLVRARHFTPHENLDMIRFARRASFPREVLRELETLPPHGGTLSGDLLDLTRVRTLSIDAAETHDVDDALSLEKNGEGYQLGVHISDVVSVVRPRSELERELLNRGTSIYTPDQEIPMLPLELSHDRVSLLPRKKRRAMSFLFEVGPDFEIRSVSIRRSVIEVRDRLTYDDVDSALFRDHHSGPLLENTLEEILFTLWRITSAREEKRRSQGAMAFSRREMTPKLHLDGHISIEETKEDTPARKLVSELMVLANESAARFARDRGAELIFRSQEGPSENLEHIGLEIENDIAREYLRRSFLKRSIVGTHPLPHFGLGLEVYTQVTSPIRRAFDFVNQRQIAHILDTGEAFYKPGEIGELIPQIEARLDEASFIQRERNRYWLLSYLVQEKFTTLEGVVVKIDGPKPQAELWPINLVYPFVPAPSKGRTQTKKALGELVRFRIEEIHPRKGILRLTEIPRET